MIRLSRKELWFVLMAYVAALASSVTAFVMHGQAWQLAMAGASLFGVCVCVHLLARKQ